jgi:hypothetical protein
MIVRLVADLQNGLFWRVGTGRASECCVSSAAMGPDIPRWAAMCWLSSACTALSLCVAADRVVLIAAASPNQQQGRCLVRTSVGPAGGLQTGGYNTVTWANIATAVNMRTYLA